jgi:hypothetical protein
MYIRNTHEYLASHKSESRKFDTIAKRFNASQSLNQPFQEAFSTELPDTVLMIVIVFVRAPPSFPLKKHLRAACNTT